VFTSPIKSNIYKVNTKTTTSTYYYYIYNLVIKTYIPEYGSW